jgi:hypothetical protein
VNTNFANFDDLPRAARNQPEPQRLLFVFATAELPDDSTPQQRADFLAGQGGALMPTMSVDKAPEELNTFAALVEESGPDPAVARPAAAAQWRRSASLFRISQRIGVSFGS